MLRCLQGPARHVNGCAWAGSVASLWQQAGRAGRREQASTSIYIAFDGPLDQYYFQHPEQLFGRPIEHSQVPTCLRLSLGSGWTCTTSAC